MTERYDFAPTMHGFLTWLFRILDPRFTDKLLKGRSAEEAAEELFRDIIAKVRADRDLEGSPTAADYGEIMDRIAALHLRTRHGDQSVSSIIAS